MEDSDRHATSPRLWLFFLPVLLIVTAIVTVQQLQASNSEGVASATYRHGVVDVAIPYDAAHSGAGQLTLEVLDPEDQVLGHLDQPVEVAEGTGSWHEQIKLAKPLALDELVWHRVRYRFEYSDSKNKGIEGTESISQILRMPVIHILGQQSYLSGGPAAVRVIVTDSHEAVIAGRSSVLIELLVPEQKSRLLFAGRLNRRGTTEAQFLFPTGVVGN